MKICRKIILLVLIHLFCLFSCKTNEKKNIAQANGDLSKYGKVAARSAQQKKCPCTDKYGLIPLIQKGRKNAPVIITCNKRKKIDLPANATDLAAGMMRDTMLSKLRSGCAGYVLEKTR